MLNRARDDRVRDAGKGAGEVELPVTEIVGGRSGRQVPRFEPAAGVVEAAELNRHAGADAEEGREGAFVEGEGPFVGPDRAGAVEGGGVLLGGLETDFDDICWEWVG